MDPLAPLPNTTNTSTFVMNVSNMFLMVFKGNTWDLENTEILEFEIFAMFRNIVGSRRVAVIMIKQGGPIALLEPERRLEDRWIKVEPCVYVWPDTNEVCFDNFNRPQYQPLRSFVHPAQQSQFTQSLSRYDAIFLHSQFLRLISGLH